MILIREKFVTNHIQTLDNWSYKSDKTGQIHADISDIREQ